MELSVFICKIYNSVLLMLKSLLNWYNVGAGRCEVSFCKFPPLKNSSRWAPQHDSEASVLRVTDGVGGGNVVPQGRF